MNRTLLNLALGFLFSLTVTAQSLDALLVELKDRNVTLLAAKQRLMSAQEETKVAGALADPTVEFGLSTSRVTEDGPRLERLMFYQELPLGGKRGFERKESKEMAEMARFELMAMELELTQEFLAGYADYYYATQAKNVTQQNVRLLEDLEKVISTNYQNGKAEYSDMIEIQIEVESLRDQLISQERALQPLATALNLMLGRPAHQKLDGPTALPLIPDPHVMDDAQVDAEINSQNPTIAAKTAQKNADRFALNRIAKSHIPDLMVGFEWMNALESTTLEDPTFMALIGVNLPVWRKRNQAQTFAASARVEAAGMETEMALNELRLAYRQAWFEYDDAKRKVALFKNQIVPKAEEALKVKTASFQNGESDYTHLIEAERALLGFRLSAHEAEANEFKAATSLHSLLGHDPFRPNK